MCQAAMWGGFGQWSGCAMWWEGNVYTSTMMLKQKVDPTAVLPPTGVSSFLTHFAMTCIISQRDWENLWKTKTFLSLLGAKKNAGINLYYAKVCYWNLVCDSIRRLRREVDFTGSFKDPAQKLYCIVDHPEKGLQSLSDLRISHSWEAG